MINNLWYCDIAISENKVIILGKYTISEVNHVDRDTGYRLRHVYQETERFVEHDHDYCEIFLTLGGNATHKANGQEVPISRGCLMFVRDTDCHTYKDYKGGFEFLNLAFSKHIIFDLCAYLKSEKQLALLFNQKMPPQIRLTDNETERLKMRIARLNTVDLHDTAARIIHMRALLCDIYIRYFMNYTPEEENVPFWLERACEKIKLPENFILGSERFYEICGRSREHTARSMKKYLHTSVGEYISDLRLSYAANLLITSNLNAADICYECGFKNLSWFYSEFSKKFGTTPAAFRNSQTKKNQN